MWEALYRITEFLWGTPLLILMIGVGFYLSVRSGFFQITGIPIWIKQTVGELFSKSKKGKGEGQLSPFQALSAVLAGTVGSGNIAGVASAIAIGGPGAVFWMWLIAIVGMMTKMVEVTLAVAYRKKNDESGEYYGGPMYYMREGLGKIGGILASIYAVALFIMVMADACFVQPNTLAVCVEDVFRVPLLVSGLVVVGISLAVVLFGGLNRIGDFCGKMVPPMIIVYILGCTIVLVVNAANIPHAFAMIFEYAFAPAPAVGGFAGAAVSSAMARGASRGIFSNEAGMGTATTVHATAVTDNPAHQGMYGILEVAVAGVLICTMTALAVLCSGVWSNGNTGVVLSFDAFRGSVGQFGVVILAAAVVLFSFSSYLGFYVEFRTCVEYLFGEKLVKILRWIYFILPILSVTLEVEQVWDIADMAVGFIVVPNMIALLLLSPKFLEIFRGYLGQLKQEKKDFV